MTPARTCLDAKAVRVARAAGDLPALHEAVEGVVIDEALQALGTAILRLCADGTAGTDPSGLAARVADALELRGWDGDAQLREPLLSLVRGRRPENLLPVDLEEVLISTSDSGGDDENGAYLNLRTGEVVASVLTDAMMVGDDAVVDVEGPEWIWVDRPSSTRQEWWDMQDFSHADGVEPELGQRLRGAIEGRGAFRRFGDVVHGDETLLRRWLTFRDDRRLGRARAVLAARGIDVLG